MLVRFSLPKFSPFNYGPNSLFYKWGCELIELSMFIYLLEHKNACACLFLLKCLLYYAD